jgi:hypothetical protein
MMKLATTRPWIIGSLAAVALGAAAGSAFAQARTTPKPDDCLTLHSATQRQECSMQREPFYTSSDRIAPQPDGRLQMNMDNGGGGTQQPVVPNTTGAPAMTGGADGVGQ